MKLHQILILIIVLAALGGVIYLGFNGDKLRDVQLGSSSAPKTGAQKNYGPAPEVVGINNWLNSDPLTLEKLRGKVVLIDFWTYSCINCIRTLPYVTKWYDTYRDSGFVVLGVHTPEFAFEKETKNVQNAIQRYKINYPVAQDNDYATWRKFANRYWPAHYLIDQNGNIVYTHFGEGKYEETENTIRSLLGLNPVEKETDTRRDVRTPEIYFGSNRLEHLSSSQRATVQTTNYDFPETIRLNEFALEGPWRFEPEQMVSEGAGKIRMKFHAAKIHMVAQSQAPITVKIIVDGQPQPDVVISESDLYTLFDSGQSHERTIEIIVPQAGLEAFTFTFG